MRRQWSRGRRCAIASSSRRRSRTTASTVSLTRSPPACSSRESPDRRQRGDDRVVGRRARRARAAGSPNDRPPRANSTQGRRRSTRTPRERSAATTAISSVGSSIAPRIETRSRHLRGREHAATGSRSAPGRRRVRARPRGRGAPCATGSAARCRRSARRRTSPVDRVEDRPALALDPAHERGDLGRPHAGGSRRSGCPRRSRRTRRPTLRRSSAPASGLARPPRGARARPGSRSTSSSSASNTWFTNVDDPGDGPEVLDERLRLEAELVLGVVVHAEVGAPEPVDRLLRIADDEERAGCDRARRVHCLGARVGVARGEQHRELDLERVGVLELVEEHGRVPLRDRGAHGRVVRAGPRGRARADRGTRAARCAGVRRRTGARTDWARAVRVPSTARRCASRIAARRSCASWSAALTSSIRPFQLPF